PRAAAGWPRRARTRLAGRPRAAAATPPLPRPLGEDLGGTVASLLAHLVRARRAAGPLVEVDEEVAVDLHSAVRVAVHAQEPGAQARVELVVPGRVERVGDVKTAPVERELEHLRAAVQLAAGVARLAEQAAEPELPGQLRVPG